MKKRLLNSVTLVTVTSVHIEDTLDALRYCLRGLSFASVKFISDQKPVRLPDEIIFCECEHIDCLESYSRFMMYRLKDYVETSHCLSIQRDGVVLHPKKWSDSFLNFDYIGAPWPRDKAFIDPYNKYQRVGNGGFSLRSKRFLSAPSQAHIPFVSVRNDYHEDVMLCVEYRHILEQAGVVFAPIEIARLFSHEMQVPETRKIKPFGFHKYRKQNRFYPKFPSRIRKVLNRFRLGISQRSIRSRAPERLRN